MAKKEEFIGIRVTKELRASLEKKAKEKGMSLSRLIEEGLDDTYHSDKERILSLIKKRKQERPEYWKELDKSPITREFEDFIGTMFTEFVNPVSRDTKHQPVILIGWIEHLLNSVIKHFDSVPETHKFEAARLFINSIGGTLIEGLKHIKSKNNKTQSELIDLESNFVEKVCFHFTSRALAKESYEAMKKEIERVCTELTIKQLAEKSGKKGKTNEK